MVINYKIRKRIGIAVALGVIVFYLVSGELSDILKTWYADNHMPRQTVAVSAEAPDQICLTLGADPRSGMAVQWRTTTKISDGTVQLREATQPESSAQQIKAGFVDLSDPMIENDPVNRRHAAMMNELKPGTKYSYRVGSIENDIWSEWTDFSTAPESAEPFSFVYLGDPQLGFDFWEKLVHTCYTKYPEAAFYLVAGDLVNRGKYRDEWDMLFDAGEGLFDRRPFVPVLGNHDYSSRPSPDIYLQLFTLPDNGPTGFYSERAYKFSYGNVLFLILDANLHPNTQGPWLEKTLREATETWKIVSFHQPAYSSKANRDNPEVRKVWGNIFDKYHVDLALQGHDHAYMRTPPINDEKIVEDYVDGTVYVVSVSGTKYYELEPTEYSLVSFAETSTYQIIEIATEPEDKLSYRAIDIDGNVKDEFVIVK